ncbi:MAG: hypothetical protein V5A43_03790 [Haloarculaceae archaeon]
MEEAAAVRRAARDAVEDVEPAPLREHIEHHLAEASMVPGVLTILCVRAVDERPGDDRTRGSLADPVAKRAAGVQLVYDGLRLTRRLATEEPWGQDPTVGEGATGDATATDDNVAILAADVLVARGFYLLARTEAADAAVGVVRGFGRDQTLRRRRPDDGLDRNLEADVLELAVVAGATLAGGQATPGLRDYAAGLANGHPFGSEGAFFSESITEGLGTHAPAEGATPADS